MLHLTVSGMTCGHCVSAVDRAVRAVPGVTDVAVDLERGEVAVTGEPDPGAIRSAVADAGYAVQSEG